MIESSVSGILPRPSRLISMTRKYDRSRVSEEELEESYRKYSKTVIDYQVESGLTYVDDGYLRRQDLLRPHTVNLEGVEVGQLSRWFNNNTFYRLPIIKEKLSGYTCFYEAYYDLLPKENLKAVVPAPYTFTKLSKNEVYGDEKEFLMDYAEILNQQLKHLDSQGVSYIQLSDPALVYHKTMPNVSELSDIAEAVEVATRDVTARTGLITYFGDAEPVLGVITDWAVSDIGVDCYETDLNDIKEHSFKDGLSLGLIDARNTLTEDVSEVTEMAKTLLDATSPKNLIVSTNCDLDFLTWKEAKKKIKTIVAVAQMVKEAI